MPETPNVMVIEARQHENIADELADGAIAVLEEAGATYERYSVPGTFELPAALRFAIRSHDFYAARQRFDGYVLLGCVIRGETSHNELITAQTARAVQDLVVQHTLALGYGVISVDNRDQAWARASVDGMNRGGAAARACLQMIELKRTFRLYPR